jgi:hypothetical protein
MIASCSKEHNTAKEHTCYDYCLLKGKLMNKHLLFLNINQCYIYCVWQMNIPFAVLILILIGQSHAEHICYTYWNSLISTNLNRYWWYIAQITCWKVTIRQWLAEVIVERSRSLRECTYYQIKVRYFWSGKLYLCKFL